MIEDILKQIIILDEKKELEKDIFEISKIEIEIENLKKLIKDETFYIDESVKKVLKK